MEKGSEQEHGAASRINGVFPLRIGACRRNLPLSQITLPCLQKGGTPRKGLQNDAPFGTRP